MPINSDLNLVLPIRGNTVLKDDPNNKRKKIAVYVPTIFAYHTPISKEVFEANFSVIALAKDAIWKRGRAYAADNGPQIARLELLKASKAIALEEETEDVGPSLLSEIERLSYVMASGPKGFEMLPIATALQQKTIDADEWAEVESNIVFFTLALSMSRRTGRAGLAEALAGVMRGSITSLLPMEYADSITTSTPAEASAKERTSRKAAAAS